MQTTIDPSGPAKRSLDLEPCSFYKLNIAPSRPLTNWGRKTCINREKKKQEAGKEEMRIGEEERRGSTEVRGKGQGVVDTSTAGNAPIKSCAVKQQVQTWS